MLPRFAWIYLLPESWVLNLATLGPIGMRLKAPGTWGTLFGLLFYTAFVFPLGLIMTWIWIGLSLYGAAAVCERAERILGRSDPGEVIIDEFVSIPLCFIGLKTILAGQPMWQYMLLAFVLFRFLDIVKPLGIRRLQSIEGGWGVVWDDVAAAVGTCALIHAWILWMA
jgi:phosphatidylglycerophosphatase A